MADITLYGLKSCDTCRKARKALEAAGKEVEVKDLREIGNLGELIPVWIEKVGADRLLNKASTTWKSLPEDEKKMAEDRTGLRAVLQAHPALIKRPVIERADAVHVGWTREVQAALGLDA